MTRIKLSYIGLARQLVGAREEELEIPAGTTIAALMAQLAQKYGEPFATFVLRPGGGLHPTARVLIDGENIASKGGIEREIGDRAEVSVVVGVYPPAGG